MKKTYENEPLQVKNLKRDLIINKLRQQKFRITEQRKLLIEIILEDECSSCKEIYYKAIKKDPSVGIATVYRMVKTLEDLEVINRKNMYLIDYDNLDVQQDEQILFVDDRTEEVVEVRAEEWFFKLKETLLKQGVKDIDNLSILIRQKDTNRKEEEMCDGRFHNCSGCRDLNCKYHSGNFSAS